MPENTIMDNEIKSYPAFGIEFIWQLEDCYEAKNIERIISLLSLDFKKDPFLFKERLKKKFSECTQLKLAIHLRSKWFDENGRLYRYQICWSSRLRRHNSIFVEQSSGQAVIVLQEVNERLGSKFLLYDIEGKNPFA